MNIKGSPAKTRTPNQREPVQPRRDHLAAWVVAQQYSTVTFVSLCFHFLKETFSAPVKHFLFHFFLYKNCVILRLRNLKLRQTGSACSGY
jgi:hypothetical protein